MADVIVTNKGREDFMGRHGGVDYRVPAGSSLPMPEAAAQHLFGFGIKNDLERIAIALRHGWHVRKTEAGPVNLDHPAILKRFEAFEVQKAKMVADSSEEESSEAEPPSVLSPRSARGK